MNEQFPPGTEVEIFIAATLSTIEYRKEAVVLGYYPDFMTGKEVALIRIKDVDPIFNEEFSIDPRYLRLAEGERSPSV